MNIVFSANNNEEIKVLPIVPSEVSIAETQNNEEFTTINNGVLNLIGDIGLRTLSIASFFPVRQYAFMKQGSSSDGWSYVDFFKKWRAKRVPLRLIITSSSGKEILNIPCTVDNFTYSEARNGNINYSLEVKEYKFVSLVV
ncbi:phage portal protein [Aminipila terrae]|uniref:Phage portal protein n=1 Tax=Aminipila terrae TaxID=2697030 RepID=A0A6P1MGG2_9FIRM|nr:phage portal protein [Aminipila terrae]QHI73780.1 phage portal protein [Aminipila terrae]